LAPVAKSVPISAQTMMAAVVREGKTAAKPRRSEHRRRPKWRRREGGRGVWR
jgi:hypothetical protein